VPVIIQTVRSNSPLSLLLIPIVGAVLWIPAFYEPHAPELQVYMPFYQPIDGFLRLHPYFSVITAFLLLIGQAFFLSFLIQQHQIITKKNWLPALIYVVLGSCTPGLHWLNASLIAGTFLLIALHLLLASYRVDRAFGSVFNAGFLIGLAGLFYIPSLVFSVFAFIVIIMLRPFIWREWVIFFLGLITPWIYMGAYFFLSDHLTGEASKYIFSPIAHRDFFLKLPMEYYALTAVIGFLLMIAIGRILSGTGAATLKTKKGVSVMTWFLLFASLAILPAQNNSVAGFVFTLYPLSMFISAYFIAARRIWIAETIFILLLLSIGSSYFVSPELIRDFQW
jgi:Family of unknown function (DUF6427)